MPIFETGVYGILIPAVLSGVLLLMSWWSGDDGRRKIIAQPGTALAFIIAFAVGYVGMIGMPAFPPVQEGGWILLAALAAAVVACIDAIYRFPEGIRFIYRLLIVLVLAYFLLSPGNEYIHEGLNGYLWLAAMTLLTTLVWWLLERRSEDQRGWKQPFLLMITLVGVTMTLMMAGSMKFGQMSVLLTSITGAAWIVSMIKPKFLSSPGGTGVISLVVFGLLFGAHLFAELPLLALVLLSIAMLVQPFWQQLGSGTLGTLPTVAIQVVLIVVITGIAFLLTYQASPPLDPYYPY
jgi:hypothetical protein